jgi:hypothetical protein
VSDVMVETMVAAIERALEPADALGAPERTTEPG